MGPKQAGRKPDDAHLPVSGGRLMAWTNPAQIPRGRQIPRGISLRRLAAAAALALAALVPARAGAQDHVALAINGWERSDGGNGIVAFRCASSICAAKSEVSYKRQPHRPEVTLAAFEAHHRKLAAESRGTGRIRDLRIAAPKERVVEGVRVLQVRREFDWVDGSKDVLIESRLIGPQKSYSLVSSSPQLAWSTNNFEGFLPRIVDLVLLESP
jgi:hypothetical protein